MSLNKNVLGSLDRATRQLKTNATYIVWPEDNLYYAKDCRNGNILPANGDAASLINSLITQSNIRIFFLVGQYDISSAIVIDYHDIWFEGEVNSYVSGGSDTLEGVNFEATSTNDIIQLDTSLVTKYLQGITIKNILFQGSVTTGGGIVGVVDDTKSLRELNIERCSFKGFTGENKYAIDLENLEMCYICDNDFLSASTTGGFINMNTTDYYAGNVWVMRNEFSPYYSGATSIKLQSTGTSYDFYNIIFFANHFVQAAGSNTHTSYYINAASGVVGMIYMIADRHEAISSPIVTTGGSPENIKYLTVIGCYFGCQSTADATAIFLHNRVWGAHICDNVIAGDAGDVGIDDEGWTAGTNANKITNNRFVGALTPITPAVNTVMFGNIGYATEKQGTATILSGTSSIAVNLSGVLVNASGSPKTVVVAVNTSGYGDRSYYASNFVSGSFTVYGITNTSADVTLSYHATYYF